ncbi:unnamed protein product [Angiostrongylus costaricensis]|uniref:Flocculation protein FLO11-like n=1 Tax=Angiostrongylus costaricensis TaxID=334426 RepID=A0A158PLR0_ANGCS|nr:unnamed protein product [Angiostrongylus costaricensis]
MDKKAQAVVSAPKPAYNVDLIIDRSFLTYPLYHQYLLTPLSDPAEKFRFNALEQHTLPTLPTLHAPPAPPSPSAPPAPPASFSFLYPTNIVPVQMQNYSPASNSGRERSASFPHRPITPRRLVVLRPLAPQSHRMKLKPRKILSKPFIRPPVSLKNHSIRFTNDADTLNDVAVFYKNLQASKRRIKIHEGKSFSELFSSVGATTSILPPVKQNVREELREEVSLSLPSGDPLDAPILLRPLTNDVVELGRLHREQEIVKEEPIDASISRTTHFADSFPILTVDEWSTTTYPSSSTPITSELKTTNMQVDETATIIPTLENTPWTAPPSENSFRPNMIPLAQNFTIDGPLIVINKVDGSTSSSRTNEGNSSSRLPRRTASEVVDRLWLQGRRKHSRAMASKTYRRKPVSSKLMPIDEPSMPERKPFEAFSVLKLPETFPCAILSVRFFTFLDLLLDLRG